MTTTCLVGTPDPEGFRPTAMELRAIEAEGPVLEAELAMVAAEAAFVANPSTEARAAIRRAERRLAELCEAWARPVPPALVDADAGVARIHRVWLTDDDPTPAGGVEVPGSGSTAGPLPGATAEQTPGETVAPCSTPVARSGRWGAGRSSGAAGGGRGGGAGTAARSATTPPSPASAGVEGGSRAVGS